MASTETSSSLSDQIINPQSMQTPHFTFNNYLQSAIPALGRPSKVNRPICQPFVQGKCPRGPYCPDRHYIPPTERSGIGHLICKHYQRGLCKKGTQCEFAHTFNLRDERECKEFSRYGICPQGDDCTYLHISPTSPLRRPACPHYARGFCALGPHCAMRHIRHAKVCPFYMAGFCPNGRSRPPDADKVVTCEFGAHARWIKDEDLHPKKPEARSPHDDEKERAEQEAREDEYYAEEDRRREKAERGEGGGLPPSGQAANESEIPQTTSHNYNFFYKDTTYCKAASTMYTAHPFTEADATIMERDSRVYKNDAHRKLRHRRTNSQMVGGFRHVRKLFDSFEITGPDGEHICLIHEALGMNLKEFRDLLLDNTYYLGLIREYFREILKAMYFLHEVAGFIHTGGIQVNVHFTIKHLNKWKNTPGNSRCHKELPSRFIYTSSPMPPTTGVPSLSDVSEARFDCPENDDVVMPDHYRAPEVILGLPWSFPIDKWALAMTIWDLFEPKRLFTALGKDGRYSEEQHLAEMTAILGPPAQDLVEQSVKGQKHRDKNGVWKGSIAVLDTTLETAEQRLEGEEKDYFLKFMRKMLP
ncbi:Hypothetical protein R9X50_00518000 [Acrodontium crateriforme]|uniref:mRNA 3'-end-processing protein n=1 Tax=Acrodontium crateriforme TaxID=150365 RepID=A0AAQ3M7D9_9PEZI|nr:Hypothetical protein R9X50_00518000 [Acrodontium crateriforme]